MNIRIFIISVKEFKDMYTYILLYGFVVVAVVFLFCCFFVDFLLLCSVI